MGTITILRPFRFAHDGIRVEAVGKGLKLITDDRRVGDADSITPEMATLAVEEGWAECPLPDWWQDWRGQTAVIVAGGASARRCNLRWQRDQLRWLVINDSWQLAPWADALYACDYKWWARGRIPNVPRLQISQDARACREFSHIKRVWLDDVHHEFLLDKPRRIASGGNSGFQALNLVLQWKPQRILLVGYDMHGPHWHGPHPDYLGNPEAHNFRFWRDAFTAAAAKLDPAIEIINCSLDSALDCFPKRDFAQCTFS